MMNYLMMPSPLGRLKLITSDQGLLAVLWPKERLGRVPEVRAQASCDHPILLMAKEQLQQYFAGSRKEFDVPLDIRGSDFQRNVWQGLRSISFGQTKSYAQLANVLGRDVRSARAVGMACGRNPLSIIIPCHRVLGASGQLTGFAGGVESKKFLLDLEQHKRVLAVNEKGQHSDYILNVR
jgi:methylated-DNA-[protein]-cysteine S-methyltransferase